MRPLRPLHHALIVAVAIAIAATVLSTLGLAPWPGPIGSISEAAVAILAGWGAARAWRASIEPSARRAWGWTVVACGVVLAARAVVLLGLSHGAAEAGAAAAQLFFVLAAWQFLQRGARRHADLEIALDTVLLTLLVAALLVQQHMPPTPVGELRTDQLLRLLTAAGGAAIVWTVLTWLLRHARFPSGAAGFALVGVGAYGVTSLVRALRAAPLAPGTAMTLELGWWLGLALVAVGGAVAPSPDPPVSPAPLHRPLLAPRIVVLNVAWIGLAWVVASSLRGGAPNPVLGALVVVGVVILSVRFSVALLADRRYAARLEQAVAEQTRSLSEALAQTAAAERELRLVMAAVPDAVVVLDAEGRVLDLNEAARAMVRASADTPPGRSLFEFLDPAAAKFVREKLALAFAGQLVSYEVPYNRDDGSSGTSWVSYAPVRTEGRIAKVIALARDVTDLRRTEAQLQQAERLASLGQMVGGVAHEVNNPAASIAAVAQALLLEPLTTEQRDLVQTMYTEAIRIGGITNNLLAFARGSGTARASVDVNELVRRTLALRAHRQAQQPYALRLELDTTEPHVWGNPAELQQVVLNLVLNAEQAMSATAEPATLTVRTAVTDTAVRLDVIDNGPGIDPEVAARVFDPFFSTRAGGAGLGLSTCYGLVKQHGGDITVDSSPGRGTIFTVTLPAERDRSLPPVSTSGAGGGAGPRTLVVEDEAGLRQTITRFLARRGIEAVAVADAEAARDALRRGAFDVVVTDVRLPGGGGATFAERLRQEQPALVGRVIVASGDLTSELAREMIAATGAATLEKPFDLNRLETLIREVARRPTAPR